MGGIRYQLKSILRDKFCLMTFLLPILAAVALNVMGSIDLTTVDGFQLGVLEGELSRQDLAWLEQYGPVAVFGAEADLLDAIKEPSTNVVGVRRDGAGIRTVIAGDELEMWRQTAAVLPASYRRQERQADIVRLELPNVLEGLQDLLIPGVLIVAMFMGCTFNAMNIISEKEDGVAFVNQVLPMTPRQYAAQKAAVGFLCGSLSSLATACICLRLSCGRAGVLLALIVLSSLTAALVGLFIGRASEGLMAGVVYIKAVMLVFIAAPVLCTLLGAEGVLRAVCCLVPSQPAFEGIMALSAGNTGTAVKDAGILAAHCGGWFGLYVLLSTRLRTASA